MSSDEQDASSIADESVPLLEGADVDSPFKISEFWTEAKLQSKMAYPISISYLLSFSLNSASIFSLGHVGTVELAASALATMFCNVTGMSIGIGMASALDTLCSQAHTASADKTVLGKHLQRALVLMAILTVPISILWLFTEPILLLVGQDAQVSKISGQFAVWMIPGLFPYFVADCLRRYLQCQGIMKASMYITMIASPLNIFLQWLLVWSKYNVGIIGAPLATSISNIFVAFGLLLYIAFIDGKEAWGGWDLKEAFDFKQIYKQLELGIPGVLMVCSEWWAFEILALLAGLFGDAVLAAQSVTLNTISMLYTLPLGLSIAISTRTGNLLGANRPFAAKRASQTGMIVAVMLAIFNVTMLMLLRKKIGYVFSSDENVVHLVASILPLAAVFQLNDGIGVVGGGVLRGCGKQKYGAIFNLIGYYILGLPIGALTAFYFHLELFGLWIGLAIGLCFASSAVCLLISRTDWQLESSRARTAFQNHSQA